MSVAYAPVVQSCQIKSFKILSADELLSKHVLKGDMQLNKFKIAQNCSILHSDVKIAS